MTFATPQVESKLRLYLAIHRICSTNNARPSTQKARRTVLPSPLTQKPCRVCKREGSKKNEQRNRHEENHRECRNHALSATSDRETRLRIITHEIWRTAPLCARPTVTDAVLVRRIATYNPRVSSPPDCLARNQQRSLFANQRSLAPTLTTATSGRLARLLARAA